jgi:hypothetical protein
VLEVEFADGRWLGSELSLLVNVDSQARETQRERRAPITDRLPNEKII